MSRSRTGFTLVELLVVIAIMGIFAAMMFPALQNAREASRRAACQSNLARLSLAIQRYESAHEVYPAGVTDTQRPILSRPNGMHHGWCEQLLVYLDERPAFARIDFDKSVYDPANAPVARLHVPELQCPSDTLLADSPHSSYAACHHDVEAPIDETNNGVFFLNSKLRPDDITDGLAYTLFLGEKQLDAGDADLGWMSGTRATLRNTGSPLNEATTAAANPGKFVGGFGSQHGGGIAMIALGDASVRPVHDSIDAKIWRLLGNRADGQMIDPGDIRQ